MPSNGSFWYGNSIGFPGFLYKKNIGVGTRRSTKMGAGGNATCNKATDIYNKYKPGCGGVGASSIANRRAKNRLATICGGDNSKCFPCYNTLGQYSNYTANPNGFVPCPPINVYNFTPTPNPNPNPNPNPIPTITAPSAPTLNSLTGTNGHLILNFTLGSDGGSSITNIEYSTNNGVSWSSSGVTSSPFAIIGLTNGVSYLVAVRAVNIVGTSPSSNVISGTPNPNTITYTTVQTTTWTAPVGVTSVDYLVVGGGGGSGAGYDTGGGGGGGGGMVLTGSLLVTPGTSYTVTVGDGGAGGVSTNGALPRETDGSSGQNSGFGSINAFGGGGGYRSRSAPGGASAGGSSVSGSTTPSTGGSGGGNASLINKGAGGGGGGSSTNGNSGNLGTGGTGGSGTLSSISGISTTYGAGGRGANGNVYNPGVAGTANTGNGAVGGGARSSNNADGAKGGSGIVIIKF